MHTFLLAALIAQAPGPAAVDAVRARVEHLNAAGVRLSAPDVETLTKVERFHKTASQTHLRLWRSLFSYPSEDAGEHARLLALWDRLDKALVRYAGLSVTPPQFSAELRSFGATLPELQRTVGEADKELSRLQGAGRNPQESGGSPWLARAEVDVLKIENPTGMELAIDTQPLKQQGQVIRGITGAFRVYAKAVDDQRKFIREFRESTNVKIVERPSDGLLVYQAAGGGLTTRWELVGQTYTFTPIWTSGPSSRSSFAGQVDDEGRGQWSVHSIFPPYAISYHVTGDLEWKQTSMRNGKVTSRVVKTKTKGSVLLRVRLAAPIRSI